jgi:membrane-associated phospholipid phosphatase
VITGSGAPVGTVQEIPTRRERALDVSSSLATRSLADRLALADLSVAGPLIVLPALVGWARVRLGRHTPWQITAGWLSALPIAWWLWPA